MLNVDPSLINYIFVLAIFVGYFVVWAVTALHTPLMSVTNAISGIIIIEPTLLCLNSDFTSIKSETVDASVILAILQQC